MASRAAQKITAYDEYLALNGLRRLDSQSIGAIYDQYFSEVYRYVRYRINDDGISEDIASDVFVRMLEAAQKNQEPQSSLRGWFIATASHAANDHLRREYRRPLESLSESIPDNGIGILAQVDLREQKQMVQSAYAQLTNEQQDVVALRFGQRYVIKETAFHMKKNSNAVKALQFRALASLQRHLELMSHE